MTPHHQRKGNDHRNYFTHEKKGEMTTGTTSHMRKKLKLKTHCNQAKWWVEELTEMNWLNEVHKEIYISFSCRCMVDGACGSWFPSEVHSNEGTSIIWIVVELQSGTLSQFFTHQESRSCKIAVLSQVGLQWSCHKYDFIRMIANHVHMK